MHYLLTCFSLNHFTGSSVTLSIHIIIFQLNTNSNLRLQVNSCSDSHLKLSNTSLLKGNLHSVKSGGIGESTYWRPLMPVWFCSVTKKKCLHGGSSQKSVSKQILDEKCVVFVEKIFYLVQVFGLSCFLPLLIHH